MSGRSWPIAHIPRHDVPAVVRDQDHEAAGEPNPVDEKGPVDLAGRLGHGPHAPEPGGPPSSAGFNGRIFRHPPAGANLTRTHLLSEWLNAPCRFKVSKKEILTCVDTPETDTFFVP